MSAVTLSAFLSPYFPETLLGACRYDGLLTLLLYALIFAGVSSWARPRKKYVYALAASSVVCCVVALLQLLDINALGLFPEGLGYYDSGKLYSGAFLGTIGNIDVLAAYFCVCIPLFAAVPALTSDRRDLLLLIPAALCLCVLLISGVASGLLAAVFAALAGVPYIAFLKGRKRLCLVIVICSAAAAAAGLCFVYFHGGESGTLSELSAVLHGRIEDSFGSSRVRIWRECLPLVGERPLFGGGPDTLGLRTDLSFSRFVESTGVTLKTRVDNAHNEFLGYLVNTGLAGLASYISVLACSFLKAVKNGAGDSLRPAFICSVSCYLVQSLFGLGLCLVAPLVWIMAGLMCSGPEEK